MFSFFSFPSHLTYLGFHMFHVGRHNLRDSLPNGQLRVWDETEHDGQHTLHNVAG